MFLPDLDLFYRSSPAYRASTRPAAGCPQYMCVQLGQFDVISDSCLILGPWHEPGSSEIASMRQSRAGADHLNTTQICRVSEWEVTSGRGSTNASLAAQPASSSALGHSGREIECFGSGQYGAVRLNLASAWPWQSGRFVSETVEAPLGVLWFSDALLQACLCLFVPLPWD